MGRSEMDRQGGSADLSWCWCWRPASPRRWWRWAAQAGPGPGVEWPPRSPPFPPGDSGRTAHRGGSIAALDLVWWPRTEVGLPPGFGNPRPGGASLPGQLRASVATGTRGNGTPAGWPLVGAGTPGPLRLRREPGSGDRRDHRILLGPRHHPLRLLPAGPCPWTAGVLPRTSLTALTALDALAQRDRAPGTSNCMRRTDAGMRDGRRRIDSSRRRGR